MADPLSTIAGVVGVLGFALHSAKRLYELIDGILGAPHDIAAISTDLKALHGVLGTLASMKEPSEQLGPLYYCLQAPLDNCVEVFEEFTTRLYNHTHTTKNGSKRKRIWSNIVWAFKEKEVQLLRDTLITYKASLDLAVVAMNFSNQDNKVFERYPSMNGQKRMEEIFQADMEFIRSKLSTLDMERDELGSLTGRQGSEWHGTDTGYALRKFLDYTGTVCGSPPTSPCKSPELVPSDIMSADDVEPHQHNSEELEPSENMELYQHDLFLEEADEDHQQQPQPSYKENDIGELGVLINFQEQCINAFFDQFYPAHPFVVPRKTYYELRQQKTTRCIEAAIIYVGSHYIPQAPIENLRLEAERAIHDPGCPQDGFRVQAMLLLAIGQAGDDYWEDEELAALHAAHDLAVELGMNEPQFPLGHGDDSNILAESWRRTWWELYVVGVMIAGYSEQRSFQMEDIAADVMLPCKEEEYLPGQIPDPHSMVDFDDKSFSGGEDFSSFTYRIAAARNLRRVLCCLVDEDALDRVDFYLVNWSLQLAEGKFDLTNPANQVDEMIFQAYMINDIATILLHLEISVHYSRVIQEILEFDPHRSVVPGNSYNIHTVKTIQAAQNISRLLQLPITHADHTPFFGFAVLLSAIVHLSRWSTLMPVVDTSDLTRHLSLNIEALNIMKKVWPYASQALDDIRAAGLKISTRKKQEAEAGSVPNLLDDEVMRILEVD